MSQLGKKGAYGKGSNNLLVSFDNPGLSDDLWTEWKKEHPESVLSDFITLYCSKDELSSDREACWNFIRSKIQTRFPDRDIRTSSELPINETVFIQEACMSYAADGNEENQLSGIGADSFEIGQIRQQTEAINLQLLKHALNVELERRAQYHSPEKSDIQTLFATDWNDISVDTTTGSVAGHYTDYIGLDVQFAVGKPSSAKLLIDRFTSIATTSADQFKLDGETTLLPDNWHDAKNEMQPGQEMHVGSLNIFKQILANLRTHCACNADCDGFSVCRGYGYTPCGCYTNRVCTCYGNCNDY